MKQTDVRYALRFFLILYCNYKFQNEANYSLLAVGFKLYQEARNYINETEILTISLVSVIN